MRAVAARAPDLALLSGFPRQMTGTFAERRLIPLMRFLLLGFPPLRGMRRTRRPGFEVDLAPRDDAWMNSSSRRGGSVHAEDYQVL